MKSPISGKTRWRRFAVLFVPAFAAAGTMVFLAATGALALNLAISGMPFKLSADSLTGNNFVQFAAPDQVTNAASGSLVNSEEGANGITLPGSTSQVLGGNTYVADTETYLQAAQITNLNQTVCAPLASLGPFTIPDLQVTIHAGYVSGHPATAPALIVQAPALTASDATFSNIIIGEDTHTALNAYGYTPLPAGTNGLFSQAADSVTINGLTQIAVGTEAASFYLPNLTMGASFVTSCP